MGSAHWLHEASGQAPEGGVLNDRKTVLSVTGFHEDPEFLIVDPPGVADFGDPSMEEGKSAGEPFVQFLGGGGIGRTFAGRIAGPWIK